MAKPQKKQKVEAPVEKVRFRSRREVKLRSGLGKAWDASLPRTLRSRSRVKKLHEEAERIVLSRLPAKVGESLN